MYTNEKAIRLCKVIGILQLAIASVVLFLFGISTVACIGDAELAADGFWQACLVFDAIGLVFLVFGIKRFRMTAELKKYMNIAAGAPAIPFEKLASLVAESEATIEKNFEWMIRKHFFEDAYINHETKVVIFKNAYMQAAAQAQRAQNVEYVTLLCECCGGTTKVVKGNSGVCEYCGAPIK